MSSLGALATTLPWGVKYKDVEPIACTCAYCGTASGNERCDSCGAPKRARPTHRSTPTRNLWMLSNGELEVVKLRAEVVASNEHGEIR